MIGDVIYSLLSNDATVSGIVGVKIFPSIALQEIALPYIVYEESNNQPTNTKDGKSELDVVSYDIEIYAENPSDLSSLSYAVRNCLDRYTGIIGGKRIDSIKYVSENTGYSLEDRVYLRVHNYDFRYFPLVQTLRQPTNLAATGNTSDITLTWVDNATGETGYKVYRGTSLYDLDLLATIAANLQTYVDSTPLANTIYYYYVVPYSSLGNGYASNVVAQKLGSGPCAAATYTIKDSAATTLYSGSIASGDDLQQTITDSTVNVRKSDNVLISAVAVEAQGTDNYLVSDSTVNIRKSDNVLITAVTVKATDTANQQVSDSAVTVNSSAYANVKATDGLNVTVAYADSLAVGTIIGSDVIIPDNRFNAASPIKTGQTTSYGDDDDGALERGSGVDFLTLSFTNPFDTTDRFTDSAGGQTYTNGEAYDWANADYVNRLVPIWYLTPQTAATWANAMTAQPYTVNSQSWYIPNVQEAYTLMNMGVASSRLNFAPFSLTSSVSGNGFWTSTTNRDSTTSAFRIAVDVALGVTSTGLGITNLAKTTSTNFLLIRYASF